MDFDAGELRDFVFKLLKTSEDKDALTMRMVMDKFMENYDLDSINKELKSQIRETVDKVMNEMYEEDDQEIAVKENTKKDPKIENKRKRDESDTSSKELSNESYDQKKKIKKGKKKQKIKSSEESDESDFVEESKKTEVKKKQESNDESDVSDHEKTKKTKIKAKKKTKTRKKRDNVVNMLFENDQEENLVEKKSGDITKKKEKLSRKKEGENTDDDDDDENEIENSKCKELVNNESDENSDSNLMALKNKLKSFEDSVKNEKQTNDYSNDSDEVSTKTTATTKSSGDFSAERKKINNESSDSSSVEETSEKNKKRKSSSSGKEDQKSRRKDQEDSSKLKGLKRYLRQCGMRVNYIKFFEECRSMKHKERKLESHIREKTGIEGRITLEKCSKYKIKKEEAEELAELDVSNIIGTPGKAKRVTRQSRSNKVCISPLTASPAKKEIFNNLRDLLDSEESESEKHARKIKKANKTTVLDSDDDDDSKDDEEMEIHEKYSGKTSDSSEVDEQNSEKYLISNPADEKDEKDMDINGNDSKRKIKDSCEEASDDFE